MVQLVQPHFESALAVAERLVCLGHQASQQSARSKWVAMGRERPVQSLGQLATGGSCVDARPTPVGMAAASAHQQQRWLPSHGKDSKTSLPRPIGVMCRGRECGSQQPASHVTSSSPHVVHAAHANGAHQQAVARDSGCGLSSSA